MARFSSWTVGKLKAELRTRGAIVTGRKGNLIERLEAYERNFDFRGEEIILPEPVIPKWPTSGFRQLSASHKIHLPQLTKTQIEGYFLYSLAGDKEEAGDIKAIEKGTAILESNRIETCSIHCTRDDVYMTGIVKAAMKKTVSHNYNLRLNGQTAEVVNSHCECPAGKGPHGTCNHLTAVLLMVSHFMAEGSPVKASMIHTKSTKRSAIWRILVPRNLAGYEDYVRNLTLNFCANLSQDLTMRFLYPKANLQAAVRDHDYLRRPFTESWVDKKLKVLANESWPKIVRSLSLSYSCSF